MHSGADKSLRPRYGSHERSHDRKNRFLDLIKAKQQSWIPVSKIHLQAQHALKKGRLAHVTAELAVVADVSQLELKLKTFATDDKLAGTTETLMRRAAQVIKSMDAWFCSAFSHIVESVYREILGVEFR